MVAKWVDQTDILMALQLAELLVQILVSCMVEEMDFCLVAW